MRFAPTICCSLAVLASANFLGADQMPHVVGDNLNNRPIDLASACERSMCLIVIGFSHASHVQVRAWTTRAENEFERNPGIVIYSVAVLQDAPRLVRGMAFRAIKTGVPDRERDHFVVLYHGEADLKRLVHFHTPDDAYVLLLDTNGKVRWIASGPVTDTLFADLKGHVTP